MLHLTWGERFQVSIGSRHVLVIGAGGLGCPASLALARSRVGTITLIDDDVVDVSNLHRQLWHRAEDVGRHKVASAAAKLRAAFPSLGIEARVLRVDASNVEPLFRAHDLVIDATDGVDIKFTLSDAAVRTGTPLIYGGVLRMQGQAMPIVKGGPCLRCLFETPPGPDEAPSCAQAGVLGSMPGIIGAVQARLAVECLQGKLGATGAADLLVFDGARLAGRTVRVSKAADCAVCGASVPSREGRRQRSEGDIS
ncbi:MAG: HesA/MoeB/ThiF family protein [Myxococcaceae bacterium]